MTKYTTATVWARLWASVFALLASTLLQAGAPGEFEITYDARLGSWRAESSRNLSLDPSSGIYRMQATSSIKLLGQNLSTIREEASFRWQDDLPIPLHYNFEQSGIGARERSVAFDYALGETRFYVDNRSGSYPLSAPIYDELTAFQVIRQQLQTGASEIHFTVLDRDEPELWHFRVLTQGLLHTDLGDFTAVHLERVRGEGNKRRTEFWLASDFDYLLLKLVQEEPNGRTLTLNVASATLNGVPLSGSAEQHMNELEEFIPFEDTADLQAGRYPAAPAIAHRQNRPR